MAQTSESTLNFLLPTQLPRFDYSGDHIDQVLLLNRTNLAQVIPYQQIQFKTVCTQLNKELRMTQTFPNKTIQDKIAQTLSL